MRISIFSAKPYDQEFFMKENDRDDLELIFHEFKLTDHTASAANRSEAVCAFVNDQLNREVLETLHKGGTKYIATMCWL